MDYSSSNKKIGEVQFGFGSDVRTGKETETEAIQLDWREQKKDVNTINEKEKNIVNDKVENGYNEKQ